MTYSVAELKEFVEQLGLPTKGLKKTDLLNTLLQYYNVQTEEELQAFLDSVETEEEDECLLNSVETVHPLSHIEEGEVIPFYGEKGWSEYVMTHFEPNELREGRPLMHGLVRVARQLLGTILSEGPTHLVNHGPTEYNGAGSSAIIYELVVEIFGQPRTFRAAGDGSLFSVGKDVFGQYPSAIAETKARSRCFRKALAIDDVVMADEIGSDDARFNSLLGKEDGKKDSKAGEVTSFDVDLSSRISDSQKETIEKLCQQLKIDVFKFINMGKGKYAALEEVNKETALKMLDKLHDYRRTTEPEEVPQEIRIA